MKNSLLLAVSIGLAAGLLLIGVMYLVYLTFQTPTEIETVTIDFEDDPINAQAVVCDYPVIALGPKGETLPEPTECDPAHHEWIKSKRIDLATSAGRVIVTNEVVGTYRSGLNLY